MLLSVIIISFIISIFISMPDLVGPVSSRPLLPLSMRFGSSRKPNPSSLPHCSRKGTTTDIRICAYLRVLASEVAQASVDAVPGCLLSTLEVAQASSTTRRGHF